MQERRPWMLDRYPYPVMNQDKQIRYIERKDFVQNHVHRKFSRMIRYWPEAHWRCFWSGVQCYHLPENLYRESKYQTPWALTLDHLCCARHFNIHKYPDLENRFNNLANLAFVGRALNSNLGHIPLPLKILHKRVLQNETHIDNMQLENFFHIRERIIETENQFRTGGLYPWQPWTYSLGSRSRLAAIDFFDQMVESEIGFLTSGVQFYNRDIWINDFEWKW